MFCSWSKAISTQITDYISIKFSQEFSWIEYSKCFNYLFIGETVLNVSAFSRQFQLSSSTVPIVPIPLLLLMR